MTAVDIFFTLVQTELWQKPLPDIGNLSGEKFERIMAVAKMQTVEGLLANAMMTNDVRLSHLEAVKVFTARTQTANLNLRINTEVKSLCQLLQSEALRFFLVKGQTIAALYPHPESRTCGDIDFYVYPECFDRARKLIEEQWKVEFEVEEEDGEQHLAFYHHGVLFEMHFNLMKFSSSRNQKTFDTLIQETPLSYRLLDDVQIPILAEELNLVYTFLHLYHHLIEIGVGIRQFCDVAILLKHMRMDEEQKGKVMQILRTINFERAYSVVESLLFNKLGLPQEKMLMSISESGKKYETLFLDIIFKRGNFGKFGRKNRVRSGWKYNIEVFGIKLRHYGKMFCLSPRENMAFLLKELPKKVIRMM